MRFQTWEGNASDWREILRRLRFGHFKWDTHAGGRCLLPPEALILAREEHFEVVHICERFDRILGTLETAAMEDPRLLQKLGLPPVLLPLLRAEPAGGPQLARYDVFPLLGGGWCVSEFNEDVPGGFNEAAGLPDLAAGGWSGAEFVGGIRAAVVGGLGGRGPVALFHATGYAEDLQHMLAVQSWFQAAGRECVLASPAHLEAGRFSPRVLGRKVGAALRFYPGEWFEFLPNRDLWQRWAGWVPMMNPLRRLIRQSKQLFAWWQDPSLLDAGDREFLRQHAPRTFALDAAPMEFWERGREHWVLKRAFGRMGDSVWIGGLLPPRAWRSALAQAVKTPGQFTCQERFFTPVLPFGQGRPMYPSLGAYLVNGRFAGYYSRADERPFITHEACHVPTLVETS